MGREPGCPGQSDTESILSQSKNTTTGCFFSPLLLSLAKIWDDITVFYARLRINITKNVERRGKGGFSLTGKACSCYC